MNLRPHHIFCVPFLDPVFTGRGKKFYEVEDRVKQAMRSESDTIIRIIEGVDELCQKCSLCQDDRCESSNGDEDEVRKWDKIILDSLDLKIGDIFTAREIRSTIRLKAPLSFCQKCRWKESCSMGRKIHSQLG